MFAIDLMYLERAAQEMQRCERQMNKEANRLAEVRARLRKIESDGMDHTRYVLGRKLEELQAELRMVRAMYQALQRICDTYRRSENRVASLFEVSNIPSSVVWKGVQLSGITEMLRS